MKISKIRILAALAVGGLIACSQLARAQDTNNPAPPPGDHKGGHADMHAKMAEELGLSEDQKTKMADVMKEQGQKRKELREDKSLSPQDRRAKGQALREETTTKIKGILTADQFAKWQKLQQNHRPGGPGGKPPGDKPADPQQ